MAQTPIMYMRPLFYFSFFLVLLCSLEMKAQSLNASRSRYYSEYKSLSFMPLQFIGNVRDEVDITVGLRYEQSLVPNEFSLNVALSRSMVNNMTYLLPGLKIFLRNKQNTRFYLMPQLYTAMGYGEWATYRWVNGIQITEFKDALRYKIGFLMNVGADFNLNNRWVMGLDYGWGLTYFDKFPTLRNQWDEPKKVRTLFQLSCGLGYKF